MEDSVPSRYLVLLHLLASATISSIILGVFVWRSSRQNQKKHEWQVERFEPLEKLPAQHHNDGKDSGRSWLPPNQIRNGWLAKLCNEVDDNPKPLNLVLEEFKETIEKDTILYMLFNLMFEEVPRGPPYDKDPTGGKQLHSYTHMLRVFNILMEQGPPWVYNNAGQQGLIGFPFSVVLDWPMATAAGAVAFIDPRVNAQFQKMLDTWAKYLASPASVSVLTSASNGWLCEEALDAMCRTASDGASNSRKSFDDYFICDPSRPHHGFTSWDDFFTRRFRPGIRPIAHPTDSAIIVNPCESSPLQIVHNVRVRDKFWLKAQPYSLIDMLAEDNTMTSSFVGGTIYQAFLSALSYHRWHSPIAGEVIKIQHIPGSYYAENYFEGFGKSKKYDHVRPGHGKDNREPLKHGADPAGPNSSQPYIAEIATRAVIYIRSPDPRLGVVSIVFIGIAEVSSCDFTVVEGQQVAKGDDIGMFHYGGSSYCLLFQKGVEVEFVKEARMTTKKGVEEVNVKVGGELARLLKIGLL